ncbi:hypothetical protein A33K_18514 [Burkholderia humptydooensis MSMB43]|uniref:Uncharacterized protein n=1 Tax=Burkholderia humptydooensis MSMB43 TaxID=441157 RepID=A0ABN0FYA3_9BURK|nr:hypothetical protein A33K_18514 [Burkholderia humptydooensis MSMB43]
MSGSMRGAPIRPRRLMTVSSLRSAHRRFGSRCAGCVIHAVFLCLRRQSAPRTCSWMNSNVRSSSGIAIRSSTNGAEPQATRVDRLRRACRAARRAIERMRLRGFSEFTKTRRHVSMLALS